MTDTTTTAAAPSRPPRKSRKWWYIGGAVVLVIALGGFGIWYFIFRDDAPPAVDIERASESVEKERTSGSGNQAATLDGTWTIDPTIGSFTDFTSAFVGYRVQEELASIGAKTAVGRTPDVQGSLTIEGKKIPEASFTANLATLQSDEDRRDNQMRSQALQTDQFPTATFELTEPIDLGRIPAPGATVQVDAVGQLTLHGATRDVTIPLQAERTADLITVTGQLDIRFADYDIDQPTSFAVLSIEDHGILEVQLFFTKT